MKNLDRNFIDWSCSLSGCNGGDPDADIWVSGIEYGIDKKENKDYYSKSLKEEIQGGECSKRKTYKFKDVIKYRYHRNVIKLYCAIKKIDIEEHEKVAEESKGKEIFKLNLYPIAFRSTNPNLWKEHGLCEITGFAEKRLYQTWCFLHRFPAISKIVKKESPKLIIGTGVSYLTDFFACYAGAINMNTPINSDEVGEGRKYYWSRLNNGTVLVVIPFFSSPSGLNSNNLLQKMGGKIRELVPDL